MIQMKKIKTKTQTNVECSGKKLTFASVRNLTLTNGNPVYTQ